jgi:hypothetical protein
MKRLNIRLAHLVRRVLARLSRGFRALLPAAKRLYIRLKFFPRQVIALLAVGFTGAVRAWPVTVVYLTLLLSFVTPGLLKGQTLLTLEGYVTHEASASWSQYSLSVVVALLLGTCLAQCSLDLLGQAAPLRSRRSTCMAITHRVLPIACLAMGFLQVAWAAHSESKVYAGLAFLLGPLTLLYWRGSRRLYGLAEANKTLGWSAGVLRHTWHILVMAVLIFLFTVEREISVGVARAFGPVTLILVFLLVFCGLATALVRISGKIGVPIPLVLIALSFVFGWLDLNDNHPVRSVEQRHTAKPVDVQDSFKQWLSSRPEQRRFSEYPVFLVSAEGGGIRAAFFTAVTLGRLVDRCPALANHLFAISGVSGGSVGAAVFVAAMRAWPPDTDDDRCDLTEVGESRYERALADVLSDDHLSLLLARALFPDMLQRFLPFAVDTFDRQRGLEWSLESSFERVFGSDLLTVSLYDFRPSIAQPVLPYLLLNATEVESGRRVVMTPLFLRTEEFGGVEDWRWFDWDHGPALSAAATTSARFPFLSPAGYQYSQGRKARYVDGGYFDNSGISTLMEVFKALYLLREQEYSTPDADMQFAVLAIHIGNAQVCDMAAFKANKSRLSAQAIRTCEQETADVASSGVGELASPLQTLINVRNAQVEYNLNRFHAELDRGTDFRRFDSHARVQMIDRGIPVPLGWLLSERVSNELRSQLDPIPREGRCKAGDVFGNYCELKSIAGVQTWRD